MILIAVDGSIQTTNEPGDDKARETTSSTSRPLAEGSGGEAGKGEKLTQADEFIKCVEDSGLDTEKAAVKHVTKVTGVDGINDIAGMVEVYTDFDGDMMSSDADKGNLIASAFTSCYESNKGLVTIYNKNGEILANGNF